MLKSLLKLLGQNRSNYIFLIVVLFGIFIRFLWLELPVGINHDEADVILSAYSYLRTGADISGVSFPRSLIVSNTEAGLSGLPSLILAPIIGNITLSLSSVRIPYVVLNSATGVVLALITSKLTKSTRTGLAVLAVYLISPWSFLYTRATTEAPFVLFFVLLGILALLQRQRKYFWASLLFFVAAFFSYQGTKVILPLLVPIILLGRHYYYRKSSLSDIAKYLFLFFITAAVFFTLSFSSPVSTANQRADELIFSSQELSSTVNDLRRESVGSTLTPLQINKFTVGIWDGLQRYLGLFSPDFLFISGDPRATYTFERHGMFYLIDVVLIMVGLVYLINKGDRLLKLLIVSLLVLAPLVSFISVVESSYVFRAVLAMPALIMLSGIGLSEIMSRKLVTVVLSIILLFSVFNFYHWYFYGYTVRHQQSHYFSERVLASYALRNNGNLEIWTTEPTAIAQQIYFYSSSLKVPENVSIVRGCGTLEEGKTTVIDIKANCDVGENKIIEIVDRKDAGTNFKVVNDLLCKNYPLERFPAQHSLEKYAIENTSDEEFCSNNLYTKS